jgi:hypothetical protein
MGSPCITRWRIEVTAVTEPVANQSQHRRMHVYWRIAGVVERSDRLLLTGQIVGRKLDTSGNLSRAEATQVLRYLKRLDDEGVLAAKAAEWLTKHRKA